MSGRKVALGAWSFKKMSCRNSGYAYWKNIDRSLLQFPDHMFGFFFLLLFIELGHFAFAIAVKLWTAFVLTKKFDEQVGLIFIKQKHDTVLHCGIEHNKEQKGHQYLVYSFQSSFVETQCDIGYQRYRARAQSYCYHVTYQLSLYKK